MSVILNISDHNIRVMEATGNDKMIQVKKCTTRKIPMGFINQGMLQKEEEWSKLLREIWQENQFSNKDVHLVFTGKRVATKILEVPELKEKEFYGYVEREFKEYDANGEQIYLYTKVRERSEEKMQQILAGRMEREELEKYQQICKDAGIRLTLIGSGINNLVYMMRKDPMLANKTCIVQIAQGKSITNMLFLDGIYNYSSVSQIFEEHGTVGYAIETARAVSEILQFMQANQIAHTDMKVYLYAFYEEDFENCVDSIEQMNSELIVQKMEHSFQISGDEEQELRKYLMACYGSFSYPKEMDFLLALKKKQKRDNDKPERKRFYRPVLILTGILLLTTIVLGILNIVTYVGFKEADDYNTQASVENAVINYDILEKETTQLQKNEDCIKKFQAGLDSHPVANSKIEEELKKTAEPYAKIVISSLNTETGIVEMTASATEVDQINAFVEALNDLDIIYNVDYSGYTMNPGDNTWNVTMVCYLNESAGKGES